MTAISGPDPITGPWNLRFHWAEIGGRMECVGLDVRSFRTDPVTGSPLPLAKGEELTPVTTALLRQIPVGREIKRSRKMAAATASYAAAGRPGSNRKARRSATTIARTFREPTGKYSKEHFLEVASVYAEAWENHESPARAVADHWSVTATTAGKWVSIARNGHGFLEPTERRKSNGRLTGKAQQLAARPDQAFRGRAGHGAARQGKDYP